MISANSLPNLDTLWDLDRPEETEKQLREILENATQNHEITHAFHVELMTQIARAKGLQGHLEEADQILEKAQILIQGIQNPQHSIGKIRYYLEKSRIFILKKTPSQARPLLIEAWTLANTTGEDFYSIDAAQLLALIEPQKKQQEWIEKALLLAEGSIQDRAKLCLSTLYTTRGWAQYDARNYEGALETFKKALSCINPQVSPRKIIVAKWAIAKTLRSLGQPEEALKIQENLLIESNRLNQKDGYIYEELAECLQSLKRNTEAQVYFDLAYQVLSKDSWFSDNKADRIKRLKNFGKSK